MFKLKFPKNKIVAKLRSLWKVHFVLTIQFVLTFNKTVLYENVTLSMTLLSTKQRYTRFLKMVLILHKTCFKVKVSKMFKISSDCHIRTCRSRKRRAIIKIPATIFIEFSDFFMFCKIFFSPQWNEARYTWCIRVASGVAKRLMT